MKMSQKFITVHILAGFHKTASSSIQLELFRKSDYLKSIGYHYPKCWRFNHNFLYGMFCDNPMEFYENRSESSLSDVENKYSNLKEAYIKESLDAGFKNYIISSEDLSVLKHHEIIKLKDWFLNLFGPNTSFNVVMFTRNPNSFITSDYQQSVKSGITPELNIYKDLFSSRIQKYKEVFGRDSLKVIDFDEALQLKKGPFQACLDAVGVECMDEFNPEKTNESLSHIALDILRLSHHFYGIHSINVEDKDIIVNIPGHKYALDVKVPSELIDNLSLETIWLKDNYGIDYSNKLNVLQCKDSYKYNIEEEALSYIDSFFLKLSDKSKALIIIHLSNAYMSGFGSEMHRDLLESLILNYSPIISKIDFKRFSSKLKSAKCTLAADYFREIAKDILSSDVKVAVDFIELAKLLRPDGVIISNLCDEFKRKLDIERETDVPISEFM